MDQEIAPKYLKGQEELEAKKWFYEAAKVAEKALCLRDKCGAVLVSDGEVIGKGYNAPPLDKEENRMCSNKYKFTGKRKSDRTCCIHAEWRAIFDALKRNPEKIKGSSLYFMRLNDKGVMTKSGEPYCTVCSRIALDLGVKNFVLWQEEGVCVYATSLYNRLSYANVDYVI